MGGGLGGSSRMHDMSDRKNARGHHNDVHGDDSNVDGFMEDDNNWHYRIPSEEELASAYKELGLVE